MREIPPQGDTPRNIFALINELIRGRSNAVGTVTLTANVTTTTVTKSTINSSAQVFLSPKTVNAAAAVATTYISAIGAGTFTITHANAATTDRTFGYLVNGG